MSTTNNKASEETNNKKKHSNYYIGGEKGGVGKSFFTRCLIDYFLHKGWSESFILIDADESINDVISVYSSKQYKTIRFSDSKFEADAPDVIIEHLAKKTVVVNLPSNISKQFDSWVQKISLLAPEYADSCDSIVYFFVTDGSYQSIRQFLIHLKKYSSSLITTCLVFNPGRLSCGGDFRFLETECSELMNALKQNMIPVVKLSELTPRLQFICDRDNIPYSEVLKLRYTPDQRNMSRFLSGVYTMLDEIFSHDISSPKGLTEIAKKRDVFHQQSKLSYLY